MASTLFTVLSLAFPIVAREFYHGVAIGDPFKVSSQCAGLAEVEPQLVMNWGPDTRDGHSLTVCGDCEPVFLPNAWGRTFDDTELAKLPDGAAPWGILLENEPNWWGFPPLTADHGAGANMTAQAAAARWTKHKQLVDTKWGPGLTKWISPSPVTELYRACRPGERQGCTFQGQFAWLDAYFAACNGCLKDMWAINTHEYSCDLERSKRHIRDVAARYGKPVFVGELGCDGPSAQAQGKYLESMVTWFASEPSVVGYIWAGLNSVGSKNAQLTANGALTPVGQSFKNAQRILPGSSP